MDKLISNFIFNNSKNKKLNNYNNNNDYSCNNSNINIYNNNNNYHRFVL